MVSYMKDKQKKPEKKKPKKKPAYTDYGITRDEFHQVLKKVIQPVNKPKSALKKSET